MEQLKNSAFLNQILDTAEELRKENRCSAVTRDHVVVAALTIIGNPNQTESFPDSKDEIEQVRSLLQGYITESSFLQTVLEKWSGKEVPSSERIVLLTQKNRALAAAKAAHETQVSAFTLLREIIKNATPEIQNLRISRDEQPKEDTPADQPFPFDLKPFSEKKDSKKDDAAHFIEDAQAAAAAEQELSLSDLVSRTKTLRTALKERVLGQDHTVGVFAEGYFQAELQAAITEDRNHPLATFLFAGPPGVGKTFLSEEAARILGLPFRRFDMSEYANPNATDELSGSDANYRHSSEGLLTGFVSRNPHCLLLFDEIEKASIDTIHLFLQILDAGRLRDNRTDKEVSFANAVLIFTTNVGRSLYEGNDSQSLSHLSREVILDALSREINPKTGEPFFPAAICSRFASGNVLMFDRLGADSLCGIVEKQLNQHVANLQNSVGITIQIAPEVPVALLLAEGANADARTVKSRADAFFFGELYELFRLMNSSSSDCGFRTENVERIRMAVDCAGAPKEVQHLFYPSEPIHALVYAPSEVSLPEYELFRPVLHPVHNSDEAREIIERENIQFIICNLFQDATLNDAPYLNREDFMTPGRSFLHDMLLRYPALPVLLAEYPSTGFHEEEKVSYLRRGVRAFITLGEPPAENAEDSDFTRCVTSVFRENSLSALARSNRLLHYETAQKLSSDGKQAEILLFDMHLEKAIKAEDTNNVMSMLSTPTERFDDVIGAEDAKNELRFFVNYMRNPKKLRRMGVSAPKGILLYGPPGTGKTMLARAFASESGATFIATEGNRFFKGYVGQGAEMVHRLFATARRYAPSVLFIDEIDAIARARSGRDTDLAQDSEQILTALFAEMDGFASDPGKPVFVLGATNYRVEPGSPMSLDPAMLRRFDRRILIDLPNRENRIRFLSEENAKKGCFQLTGSVIDSLANRSSGMSLAQLASILNLAIRSAIQNGAEMVTDTELEEAFETFNSGEKRTWSPEIMLRTARHEAGHTLISWLSGEKPSYVTIVSRADYGGYMQHSDQEDRMGYTRQELLGRIRSSLGGRAAELVCYGEEGGLSTGAAGDLKHATDLATAMLCAYGMDPSFGMATAAAENASLYPEIRNAVNKLLNDQLQTAIQSIITNQTAFDNLTQALLNRSSLRAEEIAELLRDSTK